MSPHRRAFPSWVLGLGMLVGILVGTDALDWNFIPFGLIGVRPVVVGPGGDPSLVRTLEEMRALYLTQGAALRTCHDRAAAYARHAGWGDEYRYVCCTVTLQDECRSKVR